MGKKEDFSHLLFKVSHIFSNKNIWEIKSSYFILANIMTFNDNISVKKTKTLKKTKTRPRSDSKDKMKKKKRTVTDQVLHLGSQERMFTPHWPWSQRRSEKAVTSTFQKYKTFDSIDAKKCYNTHKTYWVQWLTYSFS